MPIRKKGNIEIQTNPNAYGVKRTGYTFYSYDKNSAALYFEFNDQNGQPTDLKKATVRLVMILNDDDRKNASVTTKAEIISGLQGTAKYDIPESLLSYEGKVTGYVYLEFEDGSHADEGQFTFNIKRSMISNVLPEAGDKYVQDFEDVKERVEQAGDSAIKDIDKALPEVEDKLEDIKSKVSEVDISDRNLLKGTSDEREIYEWHKSYGFQGAEYSLGELDLKTGDTITFSKLLDNTLDDVDSQIWAQINFRDIKGETLSSMRTSSIESGQKGYVKATEKIPEKTDDLYIFKANKGNNQVAKVAAGKETKLQLGTRATPWTPAPEDVVLKSELEKINHRNLLVSSKLKSHYPYSTQPVVKDNGKEITTKVVEHGNSAISLKIDGFKPQNKKYTLSGKIEINGKPITKQMFSAKRLNLYHDKDDNERFEVYDDGTLIATETYDPAIDKGYILDTYFDGVTAGDIITFYDLQFQAGSVPTPWQPAMGDYDAKIKRLEKAIINLGGSI